METYTQLLAVLAMFAGGYGSMLFVETETKPANYELGSIVFLIGNSTNIALGLHIGDMALFSTQVGLAYFTLPMFNSKLVKTSLALWLTVLILTLGVANHFHFTASWLGVCASAVAVYGAWAMSKAKWDTMNWCWMVADLAFVYIAILNGLYGLLVLASLFVWHSYLRIMGYKRTGLFGFTK